MPRTVGNPVSPWRADIDFERVLREQARARRTAEALAFDEQHAPEAAVEEAPCSDTEVADGDVGNESDAGEPAVVDEVAEEEVVVNAVAVQPSARFRCGGGAFLPAPRVRARVPRRRRILRDNLQNISKGSIRRLARRGGVVRLSCLVYEEVRGCLKQFLWNLLRDASVYCEHRRSKTISNADVCHALARQGRVMYGYN
jgi:histone H4